MRSSERASNNRILFINPYGIGDVLFTTPLLKIVKEYSGETFIGYWCNRRVKPILKDSPYIDKIFALSRGDTKKIFQESFLKGIAASVKLFKEIKSDPFDIAFDFSLDHRYALTAKFAGIRERIGYDYKGRGRFLTQKMPFKGYRDKHIVDYYLELLRFMGIDKQASALNLFLSTGDISRTEEFLKANAVNPQDLLIGVVPAAGGSWGKDALLKHWPAVRFAALADRLVEDWKAKVIIFGNGQERDICQDLLRCMRHKPIDACSKTTLGEFSALIKRCNLLVTNDGGPLHIAVALGTKTVSMFGPVDEKVYGPYSINNNYHRVIKKDMPCRPCYNDFRFAGCGEQQRCLKDITVDEVYAAVKELI